MATDIQSVEQLAADLERRVHVLENSPGTSGCFQFHSLLKGAIKSKKTMARCSQLVSISVPQEPRTQSHAYCPCHVHILA